MRTRLKLLSSVLAAIMILTSFSLIVSADITFDAEGSNNQIEWVLYSDGLLDVYCKPSYVSSYGYTIENNMFNLSDIGKSNLDVVTTVRFDISNLNTGKWLSFYGYECAATSVIFVGPENTEYKSIEINNFPKVENGENIFFPKGASFKSMSLYNVPVKSLDFLKNTSISSLSITSNNSIESAVVPDSVLSFTMYSCSSLKKLTMPDKIQNVSLGNLPVLTDVNYPRYIKDFRWNINSLKEITVPYYGRYRFGGETLEKAVLESGRTVINEGMFQVKLNIASNKSTSSPNFFFKYLIFSSGKFSNQPSIVSLS